MRGQLDVGTPATMAELLEEWQKSLKIGDRVWLIHDEVGVVEAEVVGQTDPEAPDPCPTCTRKGPVVWDRNGCVELSVKAWGFASTYTYAAKNVYQSKDAAIQKLFASAERVLKSIEREREAAVRQEAARSKHEEEVRARLAALQMQLEGG